MTDRYGNYPNWDKFTNEQKLIAEVSSSRFIIGLIDTCDLDAMTPDEAKRFISQLKYELYLNRIDPADYVHIDEGFLNSQNVRNVPEEPPIVFTQPDPYMWRRK